MTLTYITANVWASDVTVRMWFNQNESLNDCVCNYACMKCHAYQWWKVNDRMS